MKSGRFVIALFFDLIRKVFPGVDLKHSWCLVLFCFIHAEYMVVDLQMGFHNPVYFEFQKIYDIITNYSFPGYAYAEGIPEAERSLLDADERAVIESKIKFWVGAEYSVVFIPGPLYQLCAARIYIEQMFIIYLMILLDNPSLHLEPVPTFTEGSSFVHCLHEIGECETELLQNDELTPFHDFLHPRR